MILRRRGLYVDIYISNHVRYRVRRMRDLGYQTKLEHTAKTTCRGVIQYNRAPCCIAIAKSRVKVIGGPGQGIE